MPKSHVLEIDFEMNPQRPEPFSGIG